MYSTSHYAYISIVFFNANCTRLVQIVHDFRGTHVQVNIQQASPLSVHACNIRRHQSSVYTQVILRAFFECVRPAATCKMSQV